MKRLILLALAVALLCNISCAEEIEINKLESYVEALSSIRDWKGEIEEYIDSAKDENAEFIMNQVIEEMMTCENVISKASDPEHTYEAIPFSDDMKENIDKAEDTDGYWYVKCPWQKDEEMETYINCELIEDPSYMDIAMTICDWEGNFSHYRNVEIGKRENGDILMLLIDYDYEINATRRYAVLIKEGEAKAIYTITIGRTLDVFLNVKKWKNGMDYEYWSKELLYSAALFDNADNE